MEQDANKEIENHLVKRLESNDTEKFEKDEDKKNKKSPSKYEDNHEKVESAANQEDNGEKVKCLTKREDTKKKSGTPTETCNKTVTFKRKRLVKGMGKVTQKSPASNCSNAIKAMEQDAKKEVENPIVEMLESIGGANVAQDEDQGNGKSPSKHEDNGEKVEATVYPEDNKDKVKFPTEREDTKKKLGSHAETCNNPESSKRNSLLKANGKIIKKSSAINSSSAIKANDCFKVQGKQGMRKGIKMTRTKGNLKSGSNEEVATKLISTDDKKTTNTEEQHIKNSILAPTDIEKMAESQKICKEVKNEKNFGASDTSARNEKRKEKVDDEENSELNKSGKEKLGGFIFMCSAKTKPDCFKYQLMGVSNAKRDIVLAIKPGLKLFLYDFDLKLLYGIYQASSSGGMKLEPKAFGGAFPVQVRFEVHKDCFPLPEIVFKKAIPENYFEKNKFNTELTVKQVRKLTELYRSADHHSSHPNKSLIHSPPRLPDRKVYGRDKDLRYEDSFANGDSRSYHLLAHDRDREIAHQKPSAIRSEDIPRDMFLSEKEYRAYGLQALPRDYDREHLPRNREYHQIDPIYLDEKQHLAYSIQTDLPSSSLSRGVTSHPNDLIIVHQQPMPSLDPFLPLPRREDALSSYSREQRSHVIDNNRRRDIDQVNRLYSTYASDALSRYSQTLDSQQTKRETSAMPVSSRYSFAGPSFSFR